MSLVWSCTPDDEGLRGVALRGEGNDVVGALQLREGVALRVAQQLYPPCAVLAIHHACRHQGEHHENQMHKMQTVVWWSGFACYRCCALPVRASFAANMQGGSTAWHRAIATSVIILFFICRALLMDTPQGLDRCHRLVRLRHRADVILR